VVITLFINTKLNFGKIISLENTTSQNVEEM